MDLKQLRYFVAVAEARSFTTAAERLHITQPPLSRQVQQLEQTLKVQLIKRNTRPLKLTEAGRLFYEQVSQLLHRLDQIQEATSTLGKSDQLSLTIGFVASTLYSGLPSLVRSYRQAHPNIELHFLELTSLQQIEALKSGRIDVGFGRLRVYDPAIIRTVLQEERLALAYSPFLELAQTFNKPVELEQLNEQRLIIYPSQPRPSFADQVLNALNDEGIHPAKTLEVLSLQTALGLVSAGEGLCLIPERAKIRNDINYAPLADKSISSPITFSHRANDTRWHIQAINELVQKTFAI